MINRRDVYTALLTPLNAISGVSVLGPASRSGSLSASTPWIRLVAIDLDPMPATDGRHGGVAITAAATGRMALTIVCPEAATQADQFRLARVIDQVDAALAGLAATINSTTVRVTSVTSTEDPNPDGVPDLRTAGVIVGFIATTTV